MKILSLEEFESKWSFRIKEFMYITVNGEKSDLFDFKFVGKDSLFNEKLDDEDGSKEKLLNELIDKDEEVTLNYYGSDNIKELSDEVLSMEQSPELPNDISSFICKDYGYDFYIDPLKINQSDITQFFIDFSLIDLNTFNPNDSINGLPEISYIRELFNVTSLSRLKDYVFYMLSFKVDSIEYRVMKSLLMMCYLFKKISGNNSSGLCFSMKKINFDYSMFYLRIGMLLPHSGLALV